MPQDHPDDPFSASYAEARATFLAACAQAGGEILSHRHPLLGPDGAPLFLDEARFGARDASRVLFLASGTHGIEGFCGSGIQVHLLRTGLIDRLPANVRLVLIHAVNPWGFAWLRRVNEDNVDINRNFLDHGTAYPENPDYGSLYDVLNPERLDFQSDATCLGTLRRFEQERGSEVVYRSLSGGQYDHPSGVQYGGRHPVWSNRILRSIWGRQSQDAALAVNVDLHSGLGPNGVGLVFQTAPAASIEAKLSHEWWPDVLRVEPPAGSNAALVSGLMGPAFSAARPDAASVAVVLEFGTRDMTEVMLAVRADNWLHHHGDRDSEIGRSIMQRMRDAFFMTDSEWKRQVCERASEVIDRTLSGMQAYQSTSTASDRQCRIRPAGPADTETIFAFNRAMAKETEDLELDSETLRAGTEALLADSSRGRVWVVEERGEIVASLMLTLEWSDWRNGNFWWIQSVYVTPEHRRRGHYRRLHEHVRRLAANDPDVCGLRLYVERENHAAQATYRMLGMHETHYRVFEQSTRTPVAPLPRQSVQ